MGRMKMLGDSMGQSVEGFCLIKSAAVRPNSRGVDYLDLVLADAQGECVAKLWDYNKTTHGLYEADDVVKVRGQISVWKDTEQFKIERIRHVCPDDQVDMSALVPCAPLDPAWVYEQLFAIAEAFTDDDLRMLTQYLLRENRDKLLLYPAAVKLHHATRGGLLHHVYSVVKLCEGVVMQYPALNADLLYAGAMLHDIGKLREMDTGALGLAGQYTDEGQLLGHISIGAAMVAQAAEVLGIERKTAMLVQHMLLSHHGQPDFGSPKLPMFPEAEVLSDCDMLDSRLYEMFSALEGVAKDGFSERQWALDNRQLYQH